MMSPHVDILEQPDSLKRPFWFSVLFHVSVAAVLVLYTWGPISRRALLGSPNPGGGFGANAVRVQPIVALPSHGGPENPVANPTESKVPEPRAKPKPQPKVKQPEPKAIALKGATKRPSREEYAPPNKFREKEVDRPNQLTSSVGRAMSTPMMQAPQGGGVGLGENGPFGTQFGWYASRLQALVAANWRTAGLDSRTQTAPAVVIFRILRDGSLAPGSAKVSQTSGNRALDDSALRAVLDTAPFPALPPGFPRSSADVEFRFELRR